MYITDSVNLYKTIEHVESTASSRAVIEKEDTSTTEDEESTSEFSTSSKGSDTLYALL